MKGLAAKLICCMCSYEWILGFAGQPAPGVAACPKCEYGSSLHTGDVFPFFERSNAAAD